MKFRYMSDLHLEYHADSSKFCISSHGDDAETTLMLAGDIGVVSKAKTLTPFLIECSKQFKYVMFVLGNHEFYNGCFSNGADVLKNLMVDYTNVFIMDNETVKVDDVNIIGSTMWTDFGNNNPVFKNMATSYMSDYSLIKYVNESGEWYKITPDIIYQKHVQSVEYIRNELIRLHGENVVVMTHHLPSFESVHSKYAGHQSNHFFATELQDLIYTYGPNAWIHGHTHETMDYKIGETRVVCNPHGYINSSDMNDSFDINKSFVI